MEILKLFSLFGFQGAARISLGSATRTVTRDGVVSFESCNRERDCWRTARLIAIFLPFKCSLLWRGPRRGRKSDFNGNVRVCGLHLAQKLIRPKEMLLVSGWAASLY